MMRRTRWAKGVMRSLSESAYWLVPERKRITNDLHGQRRVSHERDQGMWVRFGRWVQLGVHFGRQNTRLEVMDWCLCMPLSGLGNASGTTVLVVRRWVNLRIRSSAVPSLHGKTCTLIQSHPAGASVRSFVRQASLQWKPNIGSLVGQCTAPARGNALGFERSQVVDHFYSNP